ncbi:MAG: GTP-binding protein [Acidobacteriota bacterium]
MSATHPRPAPARFILVGGFLGAGKTTALAQLARRYADAGLRVGLITNDQAADLVDTEALRVRGFHVEEVAGGCFCCRFDDLARAATRLKEIERPQVYLAEPVGSCTDLVATVINPLKRLHGDAYRIAPYSVLLDPARTGRMFLQAGFGGFSSNVAYIFRKQVEESDIMVLNKSDTLTPEAAARIEAALAHEFPGKRICRVSALTGDGFDDWAGLLDTAGRSGLNILDLDYDTYAAGEAELGWLNARLNVASMEAFRADDLVLDLLTGIRASLLEAQMEPAHLKILFSDADGKGVAVANLIGSDDPGTRSRSIGLTSRSGALTINARVQESPDSLRARVEKVLARTARRQRLIFHPAEVASFRPARPVPVHRDREPVV